MNSKNALLVVAVIAVRAAVAWAGDPPTEIDADRLRQITTHGDVFLKDATVLPVAGPRREHTSIVVKDGKIAALVAGDSPAPDGATVIDCTGMFVTPGLIDCHSHIAIRGGVNEGTDSITAEVRIKDEIDPEDVSIYRALAGGLTTAHLLHGSSNAIGGQDAVVKLKYRVTPDEMLFPGAPQGIKFALGENPKGSNNDGEVGPHRYPATRMGVEAVIRRGFEAARDYRAKWREYEAKKKESADPATVEEPRRDLRLETLAAILEGKIRVHCHCYRSDEILMLIRVADDFGFTIGTFQHGLEAYKVAPEIAKHGAGVSTFSDWWAFKEEARDAIPYNGAILTKAGVCTSFNSDSAELMRRFNIEAAKGMKYGGLTENEALALVTINPAKQLGIDAKVGTIEVGKDADLAVWSGEPLSVYSRCEWTIVDGNVAFERADHPTALDADVAPPPAPEPASQPAAAVAAADSKEPLAPLVTAPIHREVLDRAPAHGRFALVHAKVYPVASDPIDDGVVVVSNGRIESVGKSVAPPADAAVIDCTGLRVYPGMIDCATSLGMSEIGMVRSTVDGREQGQLQSDLRAGVAVNPDSDHIPVARVNGITSAIMRPQGSLISGQSALMHLDGWTWEQMAVVEPLALCISPPDIGRRRRFGFGGGGGRFGGPLGADNSADQDRRTQELLDAFASARAWDKVAKDAAARGAEAPPVDPRIAALVPFARGERPVVFDADTQGAIEKTIDLAQKLGVRPIISGGQEAWKVAGALKAADIPVFVGPVLSLPPQRHDPYDASYANAAVLFKAGVRFAFQTGDSSNVRNLPYCAGMAAAYGLPRDEALRAVTLYPAQILGVDDALGSIRAGAFADLVVTDGDLLEARTNVKRVFIAGRDVSTDSKHTELWQRYLKRLAPEPVVGSSPAGATGAAGSSGSAGSNGSAGSERGGR